MQSSTPSSSKASSKKRERKAGDKLHKPPSELTMKELARGLFYFGPSGALKHVQYTADGQFAYQEDFLVDGQGVESKKDPLGFATLHMQVKPPLCGCSTSLCYHDKYNPAFSKLIIMGVETNRARDPLNLGSIS